MENDIEEVRRLDRRHWEENATWGQDNVSSIIRSDLRSIWLVCLSSVILHASAVSGVIHCQDFQYLEIWSAPCVSYPGKLLYLILMYLREKGRFHLLFHFPNACNS